MLQLTEQLVLESSDLLTRERWDNLNRLRDHFAPSGADGTNNSISDNGNSQHGDYQLRSVFNDDSARSYADASGGSRMSDGSPITPQSGIITPPSTARAKVAPAVNPAANDAGAKSSAAKTSRKQPTRCKKSVSQNPRKNVGGDFEHGSLTPSASKSINSYSAIARTDTNAARPVHSGDSWSSVLLLSELAINPFVSSHLCDNIKKDAAKFLQAADVDQIRPDVPDSQKWANGLTTCCLISRQHAGKKDLHTAIGLFFLYAYYEHFTSLFGDNARLDPERQAELDTTLERRVEQMTDREKAGLGIEDMTRLKAELREMGQLTLKRGLALAHLSTEFGPGCFLILSDILTDHL